MSASRMPVVETFQDYARLYQLRNQGGGKLPPEQEARWREVSAHLDAIFSGDYRESGEGEKEDIARAGLREKLPVESLRVPTDADVLGELPERIFSGRLQDISIGGAYLHARVPFHPDDRVRLTFATFRDATPLELEARVAWTNPGGSRKPKLPEGAGVQFVNCDDACRRRLEGFVYDLVETALARANLL